MIGSSVATEPRAMGFHLSASRGYTYSDDDYIHNVFHSALVLRADAWAERTYLNYLRRGQKDRLDRLWRDAEDEAEDHRNFMNEYSHISFDDLIIEKPWDKLNECRHGRHKSELLISKANFQDLIKGTPAEMLYPGKYQRQLEELIRTRLSDAVYQNA